MDKHDTIGFDLVGMLVDDLVVCGAEPLFLTDYIATGRVVPERIAAIVKGIAEACVEAGCALIGGETAEHPGLLGPDEYDVAGSTTGVVEASRLLGAGRVRRGRRGRRDGVERAALQRLLPGPPRAARPPRRRLGAGPRRPGARPDARRGAARADPDLREGLPRPAPARGPRCTRCPTSPAAASPPTSPGCCRPELTATVDRSTWTPAPVFDLVRQVGDVAQADLEMTLNCGVGMVALVAPDDADEAVRVLAERDVRAWVAGEVTAQLRAANVALVGPIPAGEPFGRAEISVHVCRNSLAPGSVAPTTETDQTGEPARA